MSLTYLSLAVIAVAALFIILEVRKGIKSGLRGSLVNLCVIFVSIVFGLIISRLISNLVGRLIANAVLEEFPIEGFFEGNIAIRDIAIALAQMLVGAVIFSSVFFLMRFLIGIIAKCVLRSLLKENARESGQTAISDDSQSAKRERLGGGITGVVCGILVSAIIMAPIVGTLKTAKDAVAIVDMFDDYLWHRLGSAEDEIELIDKYADDVFGTTLYCLGGGFIFNASASARFRGQTVSLRPEVNNIGDCLDQMLDLFDSLGGRYKNFDEQNKKVEKLCESLERSPVMKCFAANFISEISSRWLGGNEYFGFSRYDFEGIMNTVFVETLRVCQTTTEYSVVADIRSFFNVYTILMTSGIATGDTQINISNLAGGRELINKLEAEIEKNPRLEPIREAILNTVITIVAEEIHLSFYDEELYDSLMINLSTAINIVKNDSDSDEIKRLQLEAYTKEYMNDFGAQIPDEMATIVSDAMLDQFGSKEEDVSAEELDAYFKSLLGDNEY